MSSDDLSTGERRPSAGSLGIGELLSAGVEGLASVTGVQIVALLSLLGLAGTVAFQSLMAEYIAFAREQGLDPEVIDSFEQSLGPLPLAFDLPIGLSVGALLLLPIVSEAVRIVAVRAFADGDLGGLSTARVWPNLTKATILGFVGGVVLLIATSVGLALFVAPGIFVAVTMLFFRQEIAVADKGIVDGISGSWELTKGHRWELLGLLFVLFVVGIGLSLVTFVLPAGSVLVPTLGSTLGTVGLVFAAAVVTEAYVTLRDTSPNDDVPMGPDELDQVDWERQDDW